MRVARAPNVLLVYPRFAAATFWNFAATCELMGARYPSAPLGLITLAALLPRTWNMRLIDRNAEELTDADLAWADIVMTGGMLAQHNDLLEVIRIAQAHGRPIAVGGPGPTSVPDAYRHADFLVLGEAEGIIDTFVAAWEQGASQGVFEAEKFQADVTKSPIPRFDLLNFDYYLHVGVQFSDTKSNKTGNASAHVISTTCRYRSSTPSRRAAVSTSATCAASAARKRSSRSKA